MAEQINFVKLFPLKSYHFKAMAPSVPTIVEINADTKRQ